MAKRSGSGVGVFVLYGALAAGSAIFQFIAANLLGIGALLATVLIVWVWYSVVKSQRRKRAHQAFVDELNAQYAPSTVDRILCHEIWRGQTEKQLRYSRGEPDAVDQKILKTKTKEVWKYDEVRKGQFRVRVTLDNGRVVSWDERNA